MRQEVIGKTYEAWFADTDTCKRFLRTLRFEPQNGRIFDPLNYKIDAAGRRTFIPCDQAVYGQHLTVEEAEDGLTTYAHMQAQDVRSQCLRLIEGQIGSHDSLADLATETLVSLVLELREPYNN